MIILEGKDNSHSASLISQTRFKDSIAIDAIANRSDIFDWYLFGNHVTIASFLAIEMTTLFNYFGESHS
jgi:hypothetical protein